MAIRGELFLCGLGMDRRGDMTVATREAIASCHRLYYMHADGPRLKSWFGSLGPLLRLLRPDEESLDDQGRIEVFGSEICEDLQHGRRVAYLTYGHPVLLSDGVNIANFCRTRNFKCRVFNAVSSVDAILSLIGLEAELDYGFIVRHVKDILDEGLPAPFGGIALIVLCGDALVADRRFQDFCRCLRQAFPSEHPVYAVRCFDGINEAVLLRTDVRGLPEFQKKIVHNMSFVLPPVNSD